MVNNRFAVIGLGQFGNAIAQKLSQRGAEVLAIDMDEDVVEEIKDDVAFAVALDSTDKKALRSQNIQDMDGVVVAIGQNFEALLLTTVMLQELNVKRLIARANDLQQRRILEKIGITEILSPEEEVASIVAERLTNPSILSSLILPDDYEIVELKTPPGIANRTLEDINLRAKYRLNLITIKREYEENQKGMVVKRMHILGVPESSTVIYFTDILVLFGTTTDIERFTEINK
jgi:trk system potassium uptake protein TrkA